MLKTRQEVLKLHASDNVLVALRDLPAGALVAIGEETIVLKEAVKAKHKFFTGSVKKDADIIMYGTLVGKAKHDIEKGCVMNVENVQHAAEPYSYRHADWQWQQPDVSKYRNRTFKGYKRSDGRVGTANYWLFIPTVFCENRNLDVIKEALHNELGYATAQKYKIFTRQLLQAYQNGELLLDKIIPLPAAGSHEKRVFENVDGIKFLNHHGGCGGTRQDAATLSALLASYANHPNVAGITVLSLGCQHLQLQDFLRDLKLQNPAFDKPLLVYEQQAALSEEQLISKAIRETFEGLITINKLRRTPVPLSELCVGVKCGGSDGFSGVSANPAVGYTADLVVALGGKVLLAEFPELCGVEQHMIDRCQSEESAKKFIQLMTSYDELAHKVGSGFYMNPSPGNIRDGLITDAIKSAGAARKGGTSPIVDVLDYTEPAKRAGLNLVCTPGNDVEATTGKTAAGATLILFTTGLGTPTGNPVCPVIKVASNTSLAERMQDIIDIDCGPIIEGVKTIQEMGEEILEYCIRAASGEVVPKAVALMQDDFIPWKKGVSL